jgi:hypothetical protein
MKIIDLVYKFNDSLEIEYNGYTFQSLKLRKFEDYTWRNEEERNTYFKNLLQDKSENNMLLFIQMQKKEFLENIHVNLSRRFVARYMAGFFLGIALIMMSIGFALATIVNSALCLLLLLLSFYFTWKAARNYRDCTLTPILIEMIFSMK